MEQVSILKQYSLSYSDVYDDEVDDIATLVRNIPQEAATKFICYLLHLFNVRQKEDSKFHSGHLFQWMMQLTGEDQGRLLRFISKNQSLVASENFVLLSRRPCLDLIQHLLVYGDSNDNRDLEANDYSSLFRVLLLLNSKENAIQEKLFNWDIAGSFDTFANNILIVQMRNLENERFKYYYVSFLKAHYFFSFCEGSEKYSGYLKIFLKNIGLSNYQTYLWKLFSTYSDLITNSEPTPMMHLGNEASELQFYERMAINKHISEVDVDYKYLRSYPLFKTGPSTFLFLDSRFFIDKFYWGCLFDFSSEVGISFADLKMDMGNDFSEKVLFYTIMDKCFTKYGDLNLNGTQLKSILGSSEPDFYIRHGSEVFLFEFKDILIPASIKYANDPEKIKKGILDRLEKSPKGKRKGIRQLLHCIKEIQGGVYYDRGVDILPGDKATIYPVIVHTDISLESSGINYFLNKRMKEVAEKESVKIHQVENLIVIHLDTFIQLQDHFNDRTLLLADCFKAYISYISSGDPVTDTLSFDEFVKYYLVRQKKGKIGPPKAFYSVIKDFTQSS